MTGYLPRRELGLFRTVGPRLPPGLSEIGFVCTACPALPLMDPANWVCLYDKPGVRSAAAFAPVRAAQIGFVCTTGLPAPSRPALRNWVCFAHRVREGPGDSAATPYSIRNPQSEIRLSLRPLHGGVVANWLRLYNTPQSHLPIPVPPAADWLCLYAEASLPAAGPRQLASFRTSHFQLLPNWLCLYRGLPTDYRLLPFGFVSHESSPPRHREHGGGPSHPL